MTQILIIGLLAFSTGLLFYAALLRDENIELRERLERFKEGDVGGSKVG